VTVGVTGSVKYSQGISASSQVSKPSASRLRMLAAEAREVKPATAAKRLKKRIVEREA
jgi:hypothetical protein